MTQGVWRDRFGDGGLLAHLPADMLDSGGRDGLSGQIAREQPLLGPCLAPVGPQDVQELGRQHDVAVLAPFARVDADHHALAVDRIGRQADRFGDPQAGRIAHGENDSVFRVVDRDEEAVDFLLAHHDWKFLRLAARGDRVVDVPIPLKGHFVKEPDGRDRDQDRTGRQALFLDEMELVGPDIFRAKQVRRFAEVAGILGNLLQIRPLRVWREIADLHVFGHALAE